MLLPLQIATHLATTSIHYLMIYMSQKSVHSVVQLVVCLEVTKLESSVSRAVFSTALIPVSSR